MKKKKFKNADNVQPLAKGGIVSKHPKGSASFLMFTPETNYGVVPTSPKHTNLKFHTDGMDMALAPPGTVTTFTGKTIKGEEITFHCDDTGKVIKKVTQGPDGLITIDTLVGMKKLLDGDDDKTKADCEQLGTLHGFPVFMSGDSGSKSHPHADTGKLKHPLAGFMSQALQNAADMIKQEAIMPKLFGKDFKPSAPGHATGKTEQMVRKIMVVLRTNPVVYVLVLNKHHMVLVMDMIEKQCKAAGVKHFERSIPFRRCVLGKEHAVRFGFPDTEKSDMIGSAKCPRFVDHAVKEMEQWKEKH